MPPKTLGVWGPSPQPTHLKAGRPNAEAEPEPWFHHLDIYFETRNCIIHRNGEVSSLLRQKTDWYSKNHKQTIEIWPSHLDFFRHKFLECLRYIEAKIRGRFESKPSG